MRIVQICPYAMDRPGGVQRHVRDLSAWLAAEGHEVRIVAPPAPGRAPRREGPLIEIGRSRMLYLHGTGFELSLAAPWSVRRLAGELRRWGAELLHLHTPWTPLLAQQLWRALPLPAVVTLHATLPKQDGKGIEDRYIRWAARRIVARADAVVVPSESPLDALRRFKRDLQHVVIPPAIDLRPWHREGAARPRTGPVRVVSLGRLEARKGVDVLLAAWRLAVPDLDGATLTLAGDGPMRRTVEAAAAEPELRLTYAGRPEDAAARRLMAEADIFVAPAPYGESFGLVLVEAMAAGAVPVAAANPGYASVLTGQGATLLVPPGDPGALASRLVALAGDAATRARLADWAAAHAARFDIAETGPRFVELYQRARAAR